MVFDYTSTSTALTNGMTEFLVQSGVEIYWQVRYVYVATAHTDSVFRVSNPTTQGKYGLSIYDMGPATPAQIGSITSGSNRYINARSSTGTGREVPAVTGGGGGGSGVTPFTVSVTANTTGTAYYDGNGIGDAGTGDPYANEQSIYQGNPGTASGTKKSHVGFAAISTLVALNNANIYTNTAPYSGFAITKIEVYLRNRHSYSGSGLSAKIGFTSDGTVGSSIATADNGYTPTSSSFSKGQGKWVTLPSAWHSGINGAGSWGILLGLIDDNPDTYDSTLANYGYFDGYYQSDRPRVRLTYTYNVTA
jgi:hypothetical protein